MFFDPKEWTMNANGDMMFNVRTFKTIRKRLWKDKTQEGSAGDFYYFSFHDLNASQAIAFLFSSVDDAQLVHPQSSSMNWSFDMVDYDMWNELNVDFQNGLSEKVSGFDEESNF